MESRGPAMKSKTVNDNVKQPRKQCRKSKNVNYNLSEYSQQSRESKTLNVDNISNSRHHTLLVQTLLFALGLATRLWNLTYPNAIVFDELHFGKYAAMYLRNIFFFDAQPPLGKQLIALGAWTGGFDGNYTFERIGGEYTANVPVWHMRLIPAVCGGFIIPAMFYIMLELNCSFWSACIAAMLVIFDNAMMTQSRFMFMEPMYVLFLMLAVLCTLRFRRTCYREFSLHWWLVLSLLGSSVGIAFSIKYISIVTILLVLVLLTEESWKRICDTSYTCSRLITQLAVEAVLVVVLPAFIYVATFYVHFLLLTKAGPHDNHMTSAFQASLQGGLASIIKGQPQTVVYGSQITLRHTHGTPCWLHSHQAVYPIRYPDERGSSHQQQVTCYTYKDANNWWIVKHPDRDVEAVGDRPEPIKHGDVINLVHGMTSRQLHTHNVAAPLTPTEQEVTCYVDYQLSQPAQPLWRVEIINRQKKDNTWRAVHSHVRFVHVNTSGELMTIGKHLPEWAFNQFEVTAGLSTRNRDAVIWNVEEHRFTKDFKSREEREMKIGDDDLIPTRPTVLSFWEKFVEVHKKVLAALAKMEEPIEHMYSSAPLQWPLLDRTTAYWVDGESNAQIHLVGNYVIWYAGTAAIGVFVLLMVFYLLRRRRRHYDISEESWIQFRRLGEILLVGYICNYAVYFTTDASLFLHQYLPALVFQILLLASLLDHLYSLMRTSWMCHTFNILLSLFLVWVVRTYLRLFGISTGTVKFSNSELHQLTLKQSWDFIININT